MLLCSENGLSFRAERGISPWSENSARFLAPLGMTGLSHGFWLPLTARATPLIVLTVFVRRNAAKPFG
jgi:hypothetical protein